MTLRRDVQRAAFWEGVVCLACGWVSHDDEEGVGECGECGEGGLISAQALGTFLELLEGEET